jgi:glycosyltransferase involved in cell wall biosynthesis
MDLTVIVPVYNEEKNVGKLIAAVGQSLSTIDYELILIDDCSTDQTLATAMSCRDARVRIMALDKNYGQSIAIKAGIDHSTGSVVAIMDGDMQNAPEDIYTLYQLFRSSGADMIQGYRKERQDSLSKKIPSSIANGLIRYIFSIGLHDVGCSVKVFDKKLIPSLIYFKGFHRYLALIAHIRGFKVVETIVCHHPRTSGKSKYGMERFIPVCRDLFMLKTNPDRLSDDLRYKIRALY